MSNLRASDFNNILEGMTAPIPQAVFYFSISEVSKQKYGNLGVVTTQKYINI